MMEASSSNCAANPPSESVKLFVGGINESLKEEEIRDYFAKFGQVKEVVVVKDKTTGIFRGFGFVEFVDPDSAERALNEKEHAIGDRTVRFFLIIFSVLSMKIRVASARFLLFCGMLVMCFVVRLLYCLMKSEVFSCVFDLW